MHRKQAVVTGLGTFLPENKMTNQDFEKIVDTSDEWIFSRTGIRERRIASKEEFPSSMGVFAAKAALEDAGLQPEAIDAIIVSSMTKDFVSPATSALIQNAIGAYNAAAIDIESACTGFIAALSIAKGWVESGVYNNVLVIASEKNSSFVDYTDRRICVLFGDGSGAAVVQRGDLPGYGIKQVALGADGSLSSLLSIPAGGSRNPATEKTVEEKGHYLQMDGQEVFKHAVLKMESIALDCLSRAGVQKEDVKWLIPHQANIRIMQALAKRFNMPWEQVYKTIHKYGNTSSSTIPIALKEFDDTITLNQGEYILLAAFGGGLTWGAALLEKHI